MKKSYRFAPLLAMALIAFCALLSSCGKDALQKAVKDAFIKGDTTETTYQAICDIITANPGKYSDYVDADGGILTDALDQMINEVGQNLRPPMSWNTRHYGQKSLSLSIYFERSGSMVPYDQASGGGQLKKAVNDLINFFPGGENASINIVNDNIYPYSGTVDAFLQDRDIYASTKGIGDAAYTDFKVIFDKIFQAQKPGNVAVLITDLIYSPKNTAGVSVDKIFNEENSLATSIFTKYKGKSIIVNQLRGDYDGQYYPYNGQPFHYKGQRPFYAIIIADASTIDRMAKDDRFKNFLNLQGTVNSYRFNQAHTTLDYKLVPVWRNNAGRCRESRDEKGLITGCEADRETGILAFSVAVSFNGLQKDDAFLANSANFTLQSQNGFTVNVEKIAPADINGNNKAYLDGMTHVLTFTGKLATAKDEITVSLRNDFPTWIEQATSRDDSSASAPGFATTTFGLERFLRGIYDAFSASQAHYTSMTIKLEK
ncbi:MAG: hypothetical protein Q4B68_07785 [Bacteroidales bacterium]|nr:hypothetical protein [Bacteroidales bacterium]